MSPAVANVKLAEIAELNPRLGVALEDAAPVSFLPMSAVTAETASTTLGEERAYGEVRKGYTPFLNGDVLVAKITPCFENGKIAQARLSCPIGFGSTEFHVIRPRLNKADARYLLHFLRQDQIRLDGERKMTGSAGQRRVPEHFLANLDVPAPSLPKQRRIAEVLDRADALRPKRRAALAQLDSLTQSIFLDMFGDPVANAAGWNCVELVDAVVGAYGVKAGPFGSSLKKEDYATSGYRIYGQEQVIAGRFDIGDYYIDERKYQQLKSCAVAEGDLLVSLVGSFGKVLVVPSGIEPGIINPRLLKITPDRNLLSSVFLSYLLIQSSVQTALGRQAHGGTMGILNAGLLKRLKVILPPLALQQTFARRMTAIEALKTTHRAALAEHDALFASLQHRAFRGEL